MVANLAGSREQSRRMLLSQLGVGFSAGMLAGTVGGGALDGPAPTVRTDEENFTRTRVEIESDYEGDDEPTTIVATFYEPDGEGPHPALLGTHGWAGERGSLDDVAAIYANAGYAGLIYDSRGFGESDGKVTLTGEAEEADARSLIDWLADHEAIENDGENDPRVGMDGGSYGGGIQTRVAAFDDRVDAIIPRYTWHSIVQSLFPNGVIKIGWVLGLITAGATTGEFEAEFESRAQSIIEDGELTEDDVEYFESRSTVGYPDDLDAPTLVIQEFNDRLFPATEGLRNWEWARDNGVETALILGNGSTHSIFGDSPPGGDAFDNLAMDAAIAWMDDHLKDGDAHDLPPVTYYDEPEDEFVQAETFPPETTVDRVFEASLDEAVELDGPDADPITFDWEIEYGTELVGVPTLTVEVEPTGEGTRNLMATLQHVTPDGDGGETVKTIKEQVSPVAIEAETTLELDMKCIQDRLAPGDTLRLALATRSEALTDIDFGIGEDGLFRNTAEDAGVQIAGGQTLELRVPVHIEDAPAPVVGGRLPRDLDGDGLFEDVNGDGEFDIFDVQTLFGNLDDDDLQANSEFFNFAGDDPDEVGIFDVQALFGRL